MRCRREGYTFVTARTAGRKRVAQGLVKETLRNGIRRLPGQGVALLDAYRRAVLLQRQVGTKLRTALGAHLPDPDAVYWIEPSRIALHTNYGGAGAGVAPKDRVFEHRRARGKVIGGQWDRSEFRFEELDVYDAIRRRIEHGTAWGETGLHRRLSDELASHGSTSWGIRSVADLAAHFERLDRLIQSIRTHGFRRSHEIALDGEDKGVDADPRYGAEIVVNVGRDGSYLFQDGRHRLAIAKLLGVPRVPVKVLVRHPQWVEFRQFVRSLAAGGGAASRSGELYQNPVHPDLQDIPSAHGCEDRFAAIRLAVPPGPGTFLDVGANLGWFCHRFEALGYDCVAVELLPQVAIAAERIRDAERRRFEVVQGDLFAVSAAPPLRGKHFDIVLALSIFHHFIKRPDMHAKLEQWLHALDADAMIFEPHRPEEPQMADAFRNYDERQFVAFILGASCLNRAQLLHRCDDGRPIYLLQR